MTEIEKVTDNQAKARSIYNSLIKDNIFYTGISKNLAIALIELGIDSSTTDKLSVEKLQEHLLPYKKETVQKIIDEKMQLVTADEFLKLHKESLTAIRENDKLQEQINTAKNALTESEKMYQKQMDRFLNSEMNESARSHCESQLKLLFPAHKAYEALAAIGGDGCPAGPIGKNGLTKEELEGSGDE